MSTKSTSSNKLVEKLRSFSDLVPLPIPKSSYPDPFNKINLEELDEGDETSSNGSSFDSTDSLNSLSRRDEYDEDSEDITTEKVSLISSDRASNSGGNNTLNSIKSLTKGGLKSAKLRRRNLLCALPILILVLIVCPIYLLTHLSAGRHSYHGMGLKKITMAHLANGTFTVNRQSLDWLAEAGDGVYSYRLPDGSIELMDVNTNTSRYLVKGSDVKDEQGNQLKWNTFKVSADLQYILFGVDEQKQWRHSTHSNFYTHSIKTSLTFPLIPPSHPPKTAIASFSPTNHHLTWVFENDLYVRESPIISKNGKEVNGGDKKAIRITTDGSKTTFNGVPDWVYEEEVFSSDTTTFWSPDGIKLAFLSFDEELVREYEFPIYNSNSNEPGGDPYPESVVMRYPKPGFPNPQVKLSVFDLGSYLLTSTSNLSSPVAPNLHSLIFSNPFTSDDVVITEVTWVGKDDFMVKFTNRIATIERVAHFSLTKESLGQTDGVGNGIIGKVVREMDYKKLDGGWVEPGQNIVGIDSTLLLHSNQLSTSSKDTTLELIKRALEENVYPPGYLDIVPNSDGFNHIAYFSPPDTNQPVFLTNGNWEVDDGIKGIDMARGLVYFIAANPSIDRHLQSVSLPTSTELEVIRKGTHSIITNLTDTSQMGYFRAEFSPFMGYYISSYEGPGIPWQKLIKVGDKEFVDVLNDNAELARVDATFAKCELIYSTVQSEGIDLNYAELRPPFMDLSGRTQYPVLFQVYGGPASQMVSTQFARDWKHYLATLLGYIVIQVDPRGTGFKGRNFRMGVRDNLGELESRDVINAAKYFASLPYIDEKRVGIWGWSYGGYLTSKVIEADSGVFQLGMAVAPVTDWKFYDTIYTERYMSTPQLNPIGYQNSSITKMEGFKHASFALAHGSGDDNVHILNSMSLLDRFTVAQVRGVRFRTFTDSDHSIRTRGAYWELMEWLTEFLVEKFGEGGRTKAKWKMIHVLGDRVKDE